MFRIQHGEKDKNIKKLDLLAEIMEVPEVLIHVNQVIMGDEGKRKNKAIS